jgi:nucleotide-binding universal stress UspA family protein
MVEPVKRTSRRAIGTVLCEVVFFNLLFAVVMTQIPGLPAGILADAGGTMTHHEEALRDTMMNVVVQTFVPVPYFATLASLVFGLLLLSAVNTAIGGMISLQYAMARDEELPAAFLRLNMFGVPWVGAASACVICSLVLLVQGNVEKLAHLYAIGVVGAITINLGSACLNRRVEIRPWERAVLGAITAVLLVIELTIAVTKPDAALFAGSVIAGGYLLRAMVKKAPALAPYVPRVAETVGKWFAAPPLPEEVLAAIPLPPFEPTRPKIMVAARGNPHLIAFAAEEAAQREANLIVLFVRDLAVTSGPAATQAPDPQRDPDARQVFALARAAARERNVPLVPIYCVARSIPEMILDFAATYAVDFLILGVSRRGTLFRVLRGDVITQVADHLPAETTLLIHA